MRGGYNVEVVRRRVVGAPRLRQVERAIIGSIWWRWIISSPDRRPAASSSPTTTCCPRRAGRVGRGRRARQRRRLSLGPRRLPRAHHPRPAQHTIGLRPDQQLAGRHGQLGRPAAFRPRADASSDRGHHRHARSLSTASSISPPPGRGSSIGRSSNGPPALRPSTPPRSSTTISPSRRRRFDPGLADADLERRLLSVYEQTATHAMQYAWLRQRRRRHARHVHHHGLGRWATQR